MNSVLACLKWVFFNNRAPAKVIIFFPFTEQLVCMWYLQLFRILPLSSSQLFMQALFHPRTAMAEGKGNAVNLMVLIRESAEHWKWCSCILAYVTASWWDIYGLIAFVYVTVVVAIVLIGVFFIFLCIIFSFSSFNCFCRKEKGVNQDLIVSIWCRSKTREITC